MRRYVRIALGLLALGVAPAAIRSALEASGATAEDAQTAMRRARLAAEREAEPGQPDIYKHRRVLFCATADLAQCASGVSVVLCDDLADAGASSTTCQSNEAQTFSKGRAVCNASQVEIGRMAELALHDRDRDGLQALEDAEQAAGRSFRMRTIVNWQAWLDAGPRSLCPDP
jgi:hypothetical protein